MGIWIRSQSGFGLLEVNKFDVMDDAPNYFVRSDGNILGSYSSGDEAKKVLDQIQRHIGEVEYGRYHGNVIQPVFQMPEAGFSTIWDRGCR